MSRFYYTSKRKDKTSQDTHASNMIKDIIIMLGIYSTYNNHNNIGFMQYYCNITNAHANNFIGKYHYYNQGLKYFRDLAGCNGENTSRIKLNKLTHTLRTRPVRVPYNTIPLLTILFECIFSNSNLKEVFLNIVLRNCIYYSKELANYPSDCLIGIFGHIYVFTKNIATLQIYPDKYISFSEKFENRMRQMIQRYDFAKNCVQRKTN